MNQEGDMRFIDSNIWLYALLQHQDSQKSEIAKLTLQNSHKIIVSIQVINEVCVNLVKKNLLARNPNTKAYHRFLPKNTNASGGERLNIPCLHPVFIFFK
jgi:predicted nucleic acid-binding protein